MFSNLSVSFDSASEIVHAHDSHVAHGSHAHAHGGPFSGFEIDHLTAHVIMHIEELQTATALLYAIKKVHEANELGSFEAELKHQITDDTLREHLTEILKNQRVIDEFMQCRCPDESLVDTYRKHLISKILRDPCACTIKSEDMISRIMKLCVFLYKSLQACARKLWNLLYKFVPAVIKQTVYQTAAFSVLSLIFGLSVSMNAIFASIASGGVGLLAVSTALMAFFLYVILMVLLNVIEKYVIKMLNDIAAWGISESQRKELQDGLVEIKENSFEELFKAFVNEDIKQLSPTVQQALKQVGKGFKDTYDFVKAELSYVNVSQMFASDVEELNEWKKTFKNPEFWKTIQVNYDTSPFAPKIETDCGNPRLHNGNSFVRGMIPPENMSRDGRHLNQFPGWSMNEKYNHVDFLSCLASKTKYVATDDSSQNTANSICKKKQKDIQSALLSHIRKEDLTDNLSKEQMTTIVKMLGADVVNCATPTYVQELKKQRENDSVR